MQAEPFRSFINPDDPRFANPPSMVEAIKGYCRETGQPIPETYRQQARCIFDGVVSGVGGYQGAMIVIVRHGNYFSVYCNLASVSVTRGQKVSARQTLGTVGNEGVSCRKSAAP